MSATQRTATVIGAGLGGLTLALCLAQHNIKVQIFELRPADYDIGGAIMLSPNALRILDSLDVYSRLQQKGFNFSLLTFTSDADQKTTAVYHFGGKEAYGYDALRIYRKVIISELRAAVAERGIAITYGARFSHVVSESTDSGGVTFAFADGTQLTSDFLLGADGIHSSVRKYLHPEVTPTYTGFMGISYAFPRSKLRAEREYPLPINIQGAGGAFVMAPQDKDGSELFAGRQFKYESPDGRAGWDALFADKDKLVGMLHGGMEAWSDVVKSGLEAAGSAEAHSLSVWPFHVVPKMERRVSEKGRVIIVGDAAHAIPPTAGQGANQAFEDAFSLAYVLSRSKAEEGLVERLNVWQKYREERIGQVLALSNEMNRMRLAETDIEASGPEVKQWVEMGWLYNHDIEKALGAELEK